MSLQASPTLTYLLPGRSQRLKEISKMTQLLIDLRQASAMAIPRNIVSRHVAAKMFPGDTGRSVIDKLQTSRQRCDNSVLAPKEGAEALAVFHQLIFDEWASGSLDTSLARITVDERNCVGLGDWNAVQN